MNWWKVAALVTMALYLATVFWVIYIADAVVIGSFLMGVVYGQVVQ